MDYIAPQKLIDHLRTSTRQDSVLDQGFTLRADWWDTPLTGVPGGPVKNDDGTTGLGRISRRGVFALAGQVADDESGDAALRLLWHTLHWGTGDSNRGNRKRIASVTANPHHTGTQLRLAAIASREDPDVAFRILKPGLRPSIKHLGPGFFTKYLYFAGGGSADHPSLIVDSRVLRTLNNHLDGKPFAYPFGYGAGTYRRALEVLNGWADSASAVVGRSVAADEVERWAFGVGGASRG